MSEKNHLLKQNNKELIKENSFLKAQIKTLKKENKQLKSEIKLDNVIFSYYKIWSTGKDIFTPKSLAMDQVFSKMIEFFEKGNLKEAEYFAKILQKYQKLSDKLFSEEYKDIGDEV